MKFDRWREQETKQYTSHLCFQVGIAINIAYKIANNEEVFTALAISQETGTEEDYDKALKLLKTIHGVGQLRAELYLEKYFENPYMPINWEMFEILKNYQEELGWKENTIYSLARMIDDPEKIWDVHINDSQTLPLNIASEVYKVTTNDDELLKEQTVQYFVQHHNLKEMERNENRLTCQSFLYNEELNDRYNLFVKVSNHVMLLKTAIAYKIVYDFFKYEANEKLEFGSIDVDFSTLLEDQLNAIDKLKTCKSILLTGFAGTGKTYMLNKFIESIPGKSVYITSLAGKAVKNFIDALDDNIKVRTNRSTIAGLKYVPKYLKQFQTSSICIVDESSMISLHDLAFLITSLKENAKLILIGDINQLPAIELDVLNWLVNDGLIETVVLDIPKRQESTSGIFIDSMKIIDHQRPNFNTRDSQVNIGQVSIEQILRDNEDADIFLTTTNKVRNAINNQRSFEIRSKDDGHEIFDNEAYNKPIEFHQGEKIIIGNNNPETGLMNGDIFTIDQNGRLVGEDGELARDIDGNLIVIGDARNNKDFTFKTDKILDISAHKVDFAFAITTHKSQGSTMNKGVTIMGEGPLANRNLLYTAITRFKKFHKLYLPNDQLLDKVLRTGVKYQSLNEIQRNIVFNEVDKFIEKIGGKEDE